MPKKNRKKNNIFSGVLSAFFYSPEELDDESLDLIENSNQDSAAFYDNDEIESPFENPSTHSGQEAFDLDDDISESSIDANGNLIHLFNDDDLEYSVQQDFEAADKMVWDNGERVVADYSEILAESSSDDPADSDGDIPVIENDLPEEINLFDEEDDDTPTKKFSGRTRIFRTKGRSSSAVRVSINETKSIKAVEEAQKKNQIRDEQEKAKKQEKKKGRKKKWNDFFKRFAMNFVFIFFILACVIAAVYYTFRLSDIIITGNELYSSEYIAEHSGLTLGEHLFFVNLDEVKPKLEEDPYLQVNDVTYIFPSRVRIDISERKEIAGIIGLDYNVIIDENGFVLSMNGGTDVSSLLQVSGISMTGFQVGQRIGDTSDFATSTLITIIGKLEEYELLDYVSTLDMTTPLAIAMYTPTGFKIFLGQPTDLDAKFSAFKDLLPRFQASGISTGTLYLSAKNGVVYSPPNASPSNTISGSLAGELPTDSSVDETESEIDSNTESETDSESTTPEPAPATPSPVPVQPGGGDEFQG